MSKESWYAAKLNEMDVVRVSETDDWWVDYDRNRGMYRVTVFQDNHFKDEYWFDAYEEKELPSDILEPSIYRTNFLGAPYRNNFVEFDIDEQRMIREMVAITGRDRSAIIREGIRYLYDEVKLWNEKQVEHYKPVKVEWFEDGKGEIKDV